MATNRSIIQARYDEKNTRMFSLKFNLKTDADIIEKMDSVKSRNDYIRQLIREDLNRTKQQETEEKNP